MIVKAIFITLIFTIVVIYMAVLFSLIYGSLDQSLEMINEYTPVDFRFRDITFTYLRGFTWLVTFVAVAIFVLYAIHTRRR